jgi:AcrR family transcriptional regulator
MAARRARVLRDQQEGGHAQALRRHLIGVTQRLLAAHGLTGLTTRSIAREAEVSDGVLYNHFADKDDLVVTALAERLAELTSRLRRACPRAGAQDLRTGLTTLVQLSHEFQAEALPLIGGLITHPELVRELLVRFHTGDAAPQLLWQEACDYLAGEQELGTASLAVEPQLIAEIIFSTSHFRVLAELLAGHQGTAWAGDQLPEPQTERLVTFLLRACAVDTRGQR